MQCNQVSLTPSDAAFNTSVVVLYSAHEHLKTAVQVAGSSAEIEPKPVFQKFHHFQTEQSSTQDHRAFSYSHGFAIGFRLAIIYSVIEITLIDSVCFPKSHSLDGSWEVNHLHGSTHKSEVLHVSALEIKLLVFYLETVSNKTHTKENSAMQAVVSVCVHTSTGVYGYLNHQ